MLPVGLSSNGQSSATPRLRWREAAQAWLAVWAALSLSGPSPTLASPPAGELKASELAVVARMLGGVDGSQPELSKLLLHADPGVVEAAALALGRVGPNANAVRELEAVLADLGRPEAVRRAAAFALGSPLTDGDVEATLAQALAAERSSKVAVELVASLSRVGGGTAVDAITRLAQDADPARWELREAALLGLGVLASRVGPYLPEDAAKSLVAGLDSPAPEIRLAACWAVSQAPKQWAHDGLLRALRSDAPELRRMAARALADLEWTEPRELLERLWSDREHIGVRTFLAQGLARQTAPSQRTALLHLLTTLGRELHASAEVPPSAPILIGALSGLASSSPDLTDAELLALSNLHAAWRDRLSAAAAAGPARASRWSRFTSHAHCLFAASLDLHGGNRTATCGARDFDDRARAPYALLGLSKRHPTAPEAITALLTHPDASVRANAIATVARTYGLTEAEAVRGAKDPSPEVVEATATYVATLAELPGAVEEALGARSRDDKVLAHPTAPSAIARALGGGRIDGSGPALQKLACREDVLTAKAARSALRRRGAAVPACPRAVDFNALLLRAGNDPAPIGALLATEAGRVEVRFYAEHAPLASLGMAQAIRSGRLTGAEFVASLPAQIAWAHGRGQGNGAADLAFPAELAKTRPRAGTIGVTLAGAPETPAALFVLLTEQPNLYGSASAVARVVSSLDTLERLVPGDRILDARLLYAPFGEAPAATERRLPKAPPDARASTGAPGTVR
jgi:HEAT repeat protein/cyclophilin family peptidyl-prolyl cis-trans isomerase